MKDNNTYTDDEVQILGLGPDKPSRSPKKWQKRLLWCLLPILVLLVFIVIVIRRNKEPQEAYYQQVEVVKSQNEQKTKDTNAFIQVLEETINDVPLLIYIPHHAHMELTVGKPEQTDSSIIFVTPAADLRGDNYEIVGDYVLKGKQLARGQRKGGFCAIIDNEIFLGFDAQADFLAQAIAQKGYFFRQYPLVKNSVPIENKPKGKSIRRALAIRNKQVMMVESRSRESFHDFTQSLVDIGVSDAIYLVGGSVFGWYYNQKGEKNTFGSEEENFPNSNYLIWRSE